MIRYILKQQTRDRGLWTSIVLLARTQYDVQKAVRAGFLVGEQRWAENESGAVLCGIDPQGRPWA